MLPVTEQYVKEPHTIAGKPVIFKDTSDIKAIGIKARRVIAMLRRGAKFTPTQPDVISIEKQLVVGMQKEIWSC